jgi:hypothetical protein
MAASWACNHGRFVHFVGVLGIPETQCDDDLLVLLLGSTFTIRRETTSRHYENPLGPVSWSNLFWGGSWSCVEEGTNFAHHEHTERRTASTMSQPTEKLPA